MGAGGTACPVYKALFHERNPRGSFLQTATYEQEFAYPWQDPGCHLWFFDDGLPGYAWYVPKANGHVNVGLGGMADQLKDRAGNIKQFWQKFVRKLAKRGLVNYDGYHPTGYSYYLRGAVDVVSDENAYIVGDSVGLATVDMCEGIGPAVRSGLLAADSIVTGAEYSLAGIDRFSGGGFFSKVLPPGQSETNFCQNGSAVVDFSARCSSGVSSACTRRVANLSTRAASVPAGKADVNAPNSL